MPTRLGIVVDTFAIRNRGLVIGTDTPCVELAVDVRPEDQVELRRDDSVLLRTPVCGIERCSPWSPSQRFAFLADVRMTKEEVPLGCEVWICTANE
jgi:hypothetical protein